MFGTMAYRDRVHITLRHRDPSQHIPHSQVGKKKSCSGPKVSTSEAYSNSPILISTREIQLFLVGYMIVEICEIFTVGGFPLQTNVRLVRDYLLTWTPDTVADFLSGVHGNPPWSYSSNNLGPTAQWRDWLSTCR